MIKKNQLRLFLNQQTFNKTILNYIPVSIAVFAIQSLEENSTEWIAFHWQICIFPRTHANSDTSTQAKQRNVRSGILHGV